MRATLPILAATALLAAGCANGAHEVAAAPPSVSYQVTGNNLAPANARAVQYCRGYGLAAQLQGVAPSGASHVATYTCTSSAVTGESNGYNAYYGNSLAPAGAAPYYGGSYAAPAQCADFLHQNRPGGSDYHGPPVAGCPGSSY